MRVKSVYGKEILNVISAYAPQVGYRNRLTGNSDKDLNDMMQNTPMNEKL